MALPEGALATVEIGTIVLVYKNVVNRLRLALVGAGVNLICEVVGIPNVGGDLEKF